MGKTARVHAMKPTRRPGRPGPSAQAPSDQRFTERRRPNRHGDATRDLPRLEEEDVLALARSTTNPLFLVLDGIQDPHNLGACLRTANAAGVLAVIAPKDRAAPMTETVRQIACGAAEHTPFVQVTNLARFLQHLKDAGVWTVGTSDTATALLDQTDLRGPIAVVMGAEGKGIRRLTAEHCDFLVRIPMLGQVDCLNVSVATGVALFEAVRQRQTPRATQS